MPPQTHFLRLAYRGTAYRGWQWQPNVANTIEQVLQEAISRVQGKPVTVSGCGRTDAGVHATQFYARIVTDQPLRADWTYIVNRNLPDDIVIHEAIPVAEGSQARWDATSRTYDYFFHFGADAFLAPVSLLLPTELRDTMAPATAQKALSLLLGKHDFRHFCKTPDRHNTTVCTVTEAQLYASASGNRLRLRLTADRFLRAMVRITVHRMLSVLEGKMVVKTFGNLLGNGTKEVFRQAPPEGLFLSGVTYPYLSRTPELPAIHSTLWKPFIPDL